MIIRKKKESETSAVIPSIGVTERKPVEVMLPEVPQQHPTRELSYSFALALEDLDSPDTDVEAAVLELEAEAEMDDATWREYQCAVAASESFYTKYGDTPPEQVKECLEDVMARRDAEYFREKDEDKKAELIEDAVAIYSLKRSEKKNIWYVLYVDVGNKETSLKTTLRSEFFRDQQGVTYTAEFADNLFATVVLTDEMYYNAENNQMVTDTVVDLFHTKYGPEISAEEYDEIEILLHRHHNNT